VQELAGATNAAQAGERVVGACPLDCPDTCSWVVTVVDGKAADLRGNPDHPFTRGALCVKVNRYLEHAAHPDRLLHPLRRVGAKGEGRFERVTWDEALDEIAERWKAIIARYGGEAIWPYQGTGTIGWIQGVEGPGGARLWNALGASKHLPTICSIAGRVGSAYTVGTACGMDPETFADSKLILLWGTNTLTSGHHLWKYVLEARKKGAYLVAIDPIRTRTAAQADEHLAPIPGTDSALALGLLHVVVSLGAEDRDYIERFTVGWEAFRERILEFPPARVAAITGLAEEQVVALGERLARSRPTGIRATMGIQRHAGGGMTLRTLAAIGGVTGDWQYPGGGLVYSTSGWFGANRAAFQREDLRPHPVRSLVMTRLADTLLEVDDPPVMALLVCGANPVASNPDQNQVRRALSREDLFTVVLEHFATDTVDYADLVLPAAMQTEQADLHDGYGHLYLLWNEPAAAPPGECLPNSEIFRRIAAAMSFDDPGLYVPDEELARQLLDSDHSSVAGITFERLKRESWVRLNYPRPFIPFAEGFPTPSGKLEFYSEKAAADGLDPLPGYTAPREAAEVDSETARRYPLALIAPASHYFMNTIFANHPRLLKQAGGPCIVLHPDDAKARSLVSGEHAVVFNDRGSFVATVEVDDVVRRGVVASTKGYWSKLLGGANINATVAERDSDMGFGAVYHDNRVEVAAAEAGRPKTSE
jgi:anaerobic selenocysteine-containing dehydrogenase